MPIEEKEEMVCSFHGPGGDFRLYARAAYRPNKAVLRCGDVISLELVGGERCLDQAFGLLMQSRRSTSQELLSRSAFLLVPILDRIIDGMMDDIESDRHFDSGFGYGFQRLWCMCLWEGENKTKEADRQQPLYAF